MSVEKKNIIDYISEEDGRKVLSISDHLQWGSAYHLYMLQEKINMYLSAIENGQLAIYYPQATSGFLINLFCKYEPDEQGIDFLCKVKDFLNDLGYDFRYTILA
jgi:hypothetical protein